MCTEVTNHVTVAGSAASGDDWFRVDRAVVYYDHPQDVPLEHALCIDVWGGHERVAVELDARSALRLAEAILATLGDPEVQLLVEG